MQEIIMLIVGIAVGLFVGATIGVSLVKYDWYTLEESLRNEKELNAAMAKGIELRDAQIEQKDKIIKNNEIIQRELKSQVNLLHALTSLPQ